MLLKKYRYNVVYTLDKKEEFVYNECVVLQGVWVQVLFRTLQRITEYKGVI